MNKRIFTLIFAAYFIALGLSPLLGVHRHNRDVSQIIHTHDQIVIENKSFLEIESFNHSEKGHSQTQDIPITVFEYLLGDKTRTNISISISAYIKFLSISTIGIQETLSDVPEFCKIQQNFQIKKPVDKLISNSLSPRAPPDNS